MRVGLGFDAHPLVKGRALFLGGISIVHEKGLQGHSDADVLLHAICDALLGASGEGDLGHYFPDNDPKYKNMRSEFFLSEVAKLIRKKELKISYLDCVVVCEKPKLAPFFGPMRQKISTILSLPENRVNLKAKTTEGMGFAGRQEGIAAYAIVCLEEPK